jgi:hypothetical protein
MRNQRPLLLVDEPNLLRRQQPSAMLDAVLRNEGQDLLRHEGLQQQPNLLHYKFDAVLCFEGENLLRQDVLQQRPNLLHHKLNALLRIEGQDLLWQHFVPVWRNMLQRKVLRKRPILCQWAVPSLAGQSVEAADLVWPLEPRRPTHCLRCSPANRDEV